MALPFLEAMVPARGGVRATAADRKIAARSCIEMVHGVGRQHADRHREEPVGAGGRRPRLRSGADQPAAARAVPRLPDDRQQHRRAQRRSVHGAGDRRRSLPLERGVPHADRIRSRRRAPTSTSATSLDQIYAQQFGQDTPIPSMQLCIENVDQAGGCCATATRAPTPTRSAGRRRRSRCR